MIDLCSPDARTRREAVESGVSRLADDTLFEQTHVLKDRSRHPVGAYLRELMARDPGRAAGILLRGPFGPKLAAAVAEELRPVLDDVYAGLERAAIYCSLLLRTDMDVWVCWKLLQFLSTDLGIEGPEDRSCVYEAILSGLAVRARRLLVRLEAARYLVHEKAELPAESREAMERGATHRSRDVRSVAAWLLARRPDPEGQAFALRMAREDPLEDIRVEAIQELVERRPDDEFKALVEATLREEPSPFVRASVLKIVLDRRGGPTATSVGLHSDPEQYRDVYSDYLPGRHDPWLKRVFRRASVEDPDEDLREGAHFAMWMVDRRDEQIPRSQKYVSNRPTR